MDGRQSLILFWCRDSGGSDEKQSNCRQRMADDNVASGRESMEGKGGKVGGWKERRKGDKGGKRKKDETRRNGYKGVKRKKDETRRERRQRRNGDKG